MARRLLFARRMPGNVPTSSWQVELLGLIVRSVLSQKSCRQMRVSLLCQVVVGEWICMCSLTVVLLLRQRSILFLRALLSFLRRAGHFAKLYSALCASSKIQDVNRRFVMGNRLRECAFEINAKRCARSAKPNLDFASLFRVRSRSPPSSALYNFFTGRLSVHRSLFSTTCAVLSRRRWEVAFGGCSEHIPAPDCAPYPRVLFKHVPLSHSTWQIFRFDTCRQ